MQQLNNEWASKYIKIYKLQTTYHVMNLNHISHNGPDVEKIS